MNPTNTFGRAPLDDLGEQVAENLRSAHHEIHVHTDRMFAVLLVLQWVGSVAAALILSPLTWDGAVSHVHPHVWLAALGGGLLTIVPLLLVRMRSGQFLTRVVIGIAQVLFSSLMIHISGGRIEAHFHVFVSLAFLAAYRDVRLFVPTVLVVVVDHVVRGVWWPASIFGVTTGADWRWLEHGAWVLFEVGGLRISIRRAREEMRIRAEQAARLDLALKQAEKSEKHLRAGFDQAAVGMAHEALDGSILRMNDRYCEITGYSRSELATARFQDITHPDDLNEHLAAMDNLLVGDGTHFTIDKRYVHKLEHIVWVRLTMSVVRDADGKPDHLIAVVQDISEERAAQQEVAKLSLVASKARHSVIIADADGVIEWANDGFTRLTGYSLEEATGHRPGELLQGPDTDPDTRTLVREGLRDLRPVSTEILNYHKDGTPYWIDLEIAPVFDADGQVVQFIATQSDITERKRRASKLQQATVAAEMANLAKSLFLANMSHEIRTPLNGILGFADVLLQDPKLSEEDRIDYTRTIQVSGRHLLTLINDILDLSKIEAGQMQVERIEFAPHQLLAEVFSVLRVRAGEKAIVLDYAWDTAVPVTIESDPSRLRQLLMNLVGNAIKFTERGSVRLTASYREVGERASIAFAIRDTGVGIPDEKLESIFEPFCQADETVTRRFGGTGLGLTISRSIAEHLGGELHVESRLGEGSTFTATVDCGDPSRIELTRSAKREDRGDVIDDPSDDVTLSGRHVLVVDDGETNRKLVSLVLRRAGAVIATAENGAEAVAMATAGNYDVVLMDMQMPVMDGYTAAGRLRDAGYTVPIIALTAHAMKGDRERCTEAGCSGYLTKPIDGGKLLTTVSEALGSNEGRMSSSAGSTPAEPPSAVYRSQLPTDDPEIREIVEEFVDKLDLQLGLMNDALETGDFGRLAELAHWLKGSGGTVGFDCFTHPAADLETTAASGDAAAAAGCLTTLSRIKERLAY